MAMLPSVFNAEDKEKMGFQVLAPGWYEGVITKSELLTTKAGNGKYLKLEFTLSGEGTKGRKVWTNLNLVNPNQIAVSIAEKELATICDACGVQAIEDSSELHGIPIGIKLKVRTETAQWPASNETSDYCSIDDLDEKQAGVPTSGNPFE